MFRTRGFKFIVQSDRLLKSFKVVSPPPPPPHQPVHSNNFKNQNLIFSKLCFTQWDMFWNNAYYYLLSLFIKQSNAASRT